MCDLDNLLDRDFEREKRSAVPSLGVPPTLAGTVPHSLADRDGNTSAPCLRGSVTGGCIPTGSSGQEVTESRAFPSPLFDAPDECFRCGEPAAPGRSWHCATGRYEHACAKHADPVDACCGGRCRWCPTRSA